MDDVRLDMEFWRILQDLEENSCMTNFNDEA